MRRACASRERIAGAPRRFASAVRCHRVFDCELRHGRKIASQASMKRPAIEASLPVPRRAFVATRPIVKPTPEESFVLHGTENAETRFERLAEVEYVTPNALFYVRSHGATPTLDARTWSLKVEGPAVAKAVELTLEDLGAMPQRTFVRSIDCAGTGRRFFEDLMGRKAEGDPWRLGAYGIAEWTGVALADILARCGVRESAVDVSAAGLDAVKFERPIPIAKAMEPDTLVALTMNGAPLPADHGFPARLIVPGWIGAANVKWLGRLFVSDAAVHTKWNTKTYVLEGPDHAAVGPARGVPLTKQVLKSAVALPWGGELARGSVTVAGYAWSPDAAIERVDVSVDGGRTFLPARLVGPNIERAGARWEVSFEASPGELTITPRATDRAGNVQPAVAAQRWNKGGYLFGAIVPHPVRVI